MATWRITEPTVGFQPITETSTTQKHRLGTTIKAIGYETGGAELGQGEFIYLKGVASTAIGSVVVYKPDDWTTKLLDSDESGTDKEGSVGIAMSANVASQYGWYQIKGLATAKVLASFADNADVYITATGGSVDDTVVDGYLVHNCLGASAIDTPSTGFAYLEIDYPYVDGIAGND